MNHTIFKPSSRAEILNPHSHTFPYILSICRIPTANVVEILQFSVLFFPQDNLQLLLPPESGLMLRLGLASTGD
jgi:hypothetical protein